MTAYALGFHEVDRTRIAEVGGKGASLGELSKLEGIRVPEGFCVSTAAFKRVLGEAPGLDRLSRLKAEDREGIRELSAELRAHIEGLAIPDDLQQAITRFHSRLGEHAAYAVRSSATAEDLPTASFAGQQDSYLNVIGTPALLTHVSRCWASLFTERAVAYRIQHGFDHRKVHMAVVVQKMVNPHAAGTLFTADPVTSNRKVSSIEAIFGLGEALVSGVVNADGYQVRDGRITRSAPTQQDRPVLTEEQVLRLERLGRQIEAHFGSPQDIEWCLLDDAFFFVQSRPITTLYPVPDVGDGGNHVFVSVGHQQMMTDPMKPLGLSMWQMRAARPMYAAGGRLFIDCTKELSSPASRAGVLEALGRNDPLIKDALLSIIERGDFIPPPPAPAPEQGKPAMTAWGPPPPVDDDPAIVTELIAQSQASVEALKQAIQTKSGVELLDFIVEDFQQSRKSLFEPRGFGALMAGINAVTWLNDKMWEWLGEKNAADTLSQSVPNNITSEMGLALLEVADAIRPHPEVIAYLRTARDEGFLEGLLRVEGGRAAHDALTAYLGRFGIRCAGEIDVTRTRWSESPTTLVPLILSNIQTFAPGASSQKFEQGRQAALKKEQELLARLKSLPEGEQKADETQRMIRRLRNFIGYREYPKYGIVARHFVYRQALLKEAERLVQAGVFQEKEDIYSLFFEELREIVRTNQLDRQLIRQRQDEHERFQKLMPPRVITSEGEIVEGAYKRTDLPAGALVGLAVSSGVVEGRARVILDMADANPAPGDILVTRFTDPSWTPLFVSIQGLVTEVGGLMTHGAVIAREYGLPAVVGVEQATRRIRDGQRIRVHGTEGYVELLS
ncbi:phosphoenolpyruvate synthase [Corallococcus sp. AB050B]|nr:phosphoenolpyruvate synthase [Corallococcus sp. AB050B]